MAIEYYEYNPDSNELKPMKKSEQLKQTIAKVDKWAIFKQVVSMAASGCASIVISKYLRSNMPESESMFEKAVTGVGMYFITGVVGSAVSKYADQELDEWRDAITKENVNG